MMTVVQTRVEENVWIGAMEMERDAETVLRNTPEIIVKVCLFNQPLWLPPASAVEVLESEPSFCLSVCKHSHDWTVWHTDKKFYM